MLTTERLHPSWQAALADELGSAADPLRAFLEEEASADRHILPAPENWLRALELTPLDEVRVVILGQDPYHGKGQAHGLAFSVPHGMRPPPSLANIYRELEADLGIAPALHGCLEHWARQGVLLLNAVLTVALGQAGSHQGRGWERLTDAIIRTVDAQAGDSAFMLWGSHAQKKAPMIGSRHLILTAPHPSPLSAYRGFLGCRHFSQANAFLESRGRDTIDWRLPE